MPENGAWGGWDGATHFVPENGAWGGGGERCGTLEVSEGCQHKV